MKKLTIEQKAKAYDGLIERLKDLKFSCRFSPLSDTIDEIFPELKESEDERIKNEIILYIGARNDISLDTHNKWLSWLEKQGEQKPYDKVEPKLEIKEGMWYICTCTYTLKGKIIAIKGQIYKSNQDGAIEVEDGHLFIDKIDGKAQNYFKPWTIKDAKDGDVLVSPATPEGDKECPFIFKEIDKNGIVRHYVVLLQNKNLEISNDVSNVMGYANAGYHVPATKEQRDLLFQNMKEAGYEWDAEKKELKKIEDEPENYKQQVMSEITDLAKDYIRQKSTEEWSVEDSIKLQRIIDFLWYNRKGDTDTIYQQEQDIEWLKSLKERIKGE